MQNNLLIPVRWFSPPNFEQAITDCMVHGLLGSKPLVQLDSEKTMLQVRTVAQCGDDFFFDERLSACTAS